MAVARSMAKREFVLDCDKELPLEQQTTFFVVPLTAKTDAQILDLVASNTDARVEIQRDGITQVLPMQAGYFEKHHLMLAESLVGWKNFKDEGGNEIAFDKLNSDERCSILYREWREEICSFIDTLNYPSEADSKN